MAKIIVVENQISQYKLIYEPLKEFHSVFPNIDGNDEFATKNFRELIDEVRIALNHHYTDKRIKEATINVLNYIEKKNPDLMIIDHILVGYDSAGTGIDLAKTIRDYHAFPILFLSRTPLSNIDVFQGLANVLQPREWLHKGYNGEQILKNDYVKTIVNKAINDLIGDNERNSAEENIKQILAFPIVRNNIVKLFNKEWILIEEQVFNVDKFTDAEIFYLEDFYDQLIRDAIDLSGIKTFGKFLLDLIKKHGKKK